MKYSISVSILEKFRRYISAEFSNGFDNEKNLFTALAGEFKGTDKTRFGTAFHDLIQAGKPSYVHAYSETDSYVLNSFAFSKEQALMARDYGSRFPGAIYEIPISRDYKTTICDFAVKGRIDQIFGTELRDAKTSFRKKDFGEFLNSAQWKFYLEAIGAKSFCFDYFLVKGYPSNVPDGSVFPQIHDGRFSISDVSFLEICEPEEIKCFAYPGMREDLEHLVQMFAEWIEARGLWKYLKQIKESKNEKAKDAECKPSGELSTVTNDPGNTTDTTGNTRDAGAEKGSYTIPYNEGFLQLLQSETSLCSRGRIADPEQDLRIRCDSGGETGNVLLPYESTKKSRLEISRPIAFLDLETTGPNRDVDRIFEICIVKLHPDFRREVRTWKVRPLIPISDSAAKVTGVQTADLATYPTFAEISKKVFAFLKGCDIGGYNSNFFDLPVLQREFDSCGIDFNTAGINLIDAGNIFKIKETRTLGAAVKFFCGKDLEGAHGAEADTQATVDVFLAQLDHYPDLPGTAKDLASFCNFGKPMLDLSGKFSFNDAGDIVLNFGKCRGQKASDNLSFLQWMINTPGFAKDSLYVCEQILQGEKK